MNLFYDKGKGLSSISVSDDLRHRKGPPHDGGGGPVGWMVETGDCYFLSVPVNN